VRALLFVKKTSGKKKKMAKNRENIKIQLHVRDKTIVVDCGDANQKTRWLANVGVARYDDNFGKCLGPPLGLQRESGKMCDLDAKICDEFDLKDPNVKGSELHAFVVLRDSVGTTGAAQQ
jgi:hypothetical protein